MREVPPVLWEPSDAFREATTLHHFLAYCRDQRGVPVSPDDYASAHQWSIDQLEDFWEAIGGFFDVRWETQPRAVLGDRSMPGAEWYPGGTISYAEHVFRGKQDASIAMHHSSELRSLDTWTWADLRRTTAQIQGALIKQGVGQGDRVVAYMPNIPETIAAFLACAGLGATWSSASPDFGARSIIDRFAQIEPKVLLCVDGYRYGGKDFDRGDTIAALQAEMPSLEHTVTLGYLDPDKDTWSDWLATGAEQTEPTFTPLPFDHPLWVLYSSGTTGLPKAIVHGQGGILFEHLKHLALHADARPGDRLFWFSTTGWMMWNFLVGALLPGAEIVLYDGNPGYPDLGALWDLADQTKMTTFGTSAAFIGACQKAGVKPSAGRDLSALRAVGSTGSPLSPEGFQWVYDEVGADTWLFSTSGGTDVCTAFVGGCPLLPVHRGELQARALGCAVDSFDADGQPIRDDVGELVITEPMPSMPIYFWNDPDGERLKESYFELYPGTWRHGDWIEITERGTAVIYGRSDSTINRGGIRMGTSEIYRAVLALDDITDALVVDVPDPDGGDAWMPLFVTLREGAELTDDLRRALARRIREDCSPRHVPSDVYVIDEVPRTLSGKVLEVPVKRILMGTPADKAASRDSLANPKALDYFTELASQRGQV